MTETAQAEQPPSMEQILQTIKGVISGDIDQKGDDVLELTEVINEDGTVESIKQQNDVLANIDEALGQKKNISNENLEAEKMGEELKKSTEGEKAIDKADEISQANIETTLSPTPANDSPKPIEESLPETQEAPAKKSLVSEKTANESKKAIKNLVDSLTKPVSDGLGFRSGTTLEDIVVESIKPYLSQWLEKNLPSIVKNLVEKEIKKIIPKDDI